MTNSVTVSLEFIAETHQQISTESVGVYSATSSIVSKLSQQLLKGAEYIKAKSNAITTYLFKPNDFDQYIPFAKEMGYVAIKDEMIFKPMQLSVTFVENVQTLIEAVRVAQRLTTDVIEPFDLYIGKLINQPEMIPSMKYDHGIYIKDIAKVREKLTKQYKDRRQSRSAFKTLYKNMSEVNEHFCHLLTLKEELEDISLTSIRTKVSELNERLLLLHDIINDKSNNVNLTAKTTATISSLIYNAAMAVEAYAIIDSLATDHLAAGAENNRWFKSQLSGTHK